nr:zf-HC2 domain-containing protein [Gemmatimonadaceae bacterium]
MTMTPFTCDDFSEQLAAYLERDASPDVYAAMESHAAACSACAALLQEIAAITSEAGALPELVPSRELWSGIAGRIDAPVVPITHATGRRTVGAVPARTARRWWSHPAVAAAALVAITAGVTHYITKQSIEQPVAAPGVAEAPT